MANSPEWVIGFIAVTAMGATAVLVNCRGSAEELLSALTDTECTALIADPDVAARVPERWTESRLVIVANLNRAIKLPTSSRSFDEVVSGWQGLALEPVEMASEDEAVVIFTSGNLLRQATVITDYTGSTSVYTVTALTEAAANGDTFVIV